jgi:hypothetical protein
MIRAVIRVVFGIVEKVYCSPTDKFFITACIVVVALRANSLCTWIFSQISTRSFPLES